MPSIIGLKPLALRAPDNRYFKKCKQLLIKGKLTSNNSCSSTKHTYVCTLRKWWGSPGQKALRAMLAVEKLMVGSAMTDRSK